MDLEYLLALPTSPYVSSGALVETSLLGLGSADVSQMRSIRKLAGPTQPVQIFHQRVEALDLAMVVARASPKKSFVHDLRTTARCVEAQLTLLDLLDQLPPHAEEAKEVRERLKRVRRATSSVRDRDVQRDLVQEESSVNSNNKSMRSDAKQLRHHLKTQRRHRATELVRVLREEEPRLACALLLLEAKLEPAKNRIVPTKQLTTHIERWFFINAKRLPQSDSTLGKRPGNLEKLVQSINLLSERSLHDLRKRAKLCRYMAEGLPAKSLIARRMAVRFEAIHEAGGAWHDWLLLMDIAAKGGGNHARLTEQYAERQDVALTNYRLRLVALLPILDASVPRRAGRPSPDLVAKSGSPGSPKKGRGNKSTSPRP